MTCLARAGKWGAFGSNGETWSTVAALPSAPARPTNPNPPPAVRKISRRLIGPLVRRSFILLSLPRLVDVVELPGAEHGLRKLLPGGFPAARILLRGFQKLESVLNLLRARLAP